MKVTKFGHSALLIEEGGLRILLDPGTYAQIPDLSNLDMILITHEHEDHVSIEKITTLRRNNKNVEIITHHGVKKMLDDVQIACTLLNSGEELIRNGVHIKAFGSLHACIHSELPIVSNTGFLIGKKLFYPGDAFTIPDEHIPILALPVAAPWLCIEDAIEYARKLNPRVVFPVHDGMLRPEFNGPTRRIPQTLLKQNGVHFVDMLEGDVKEFDVFLGSYNNG